jgi:hypothetical protein
LVVMGRRQNGGRELGGRVVAGVEFEIKVVAEKVAR